MNDIELLVLDKIKLLDTSNPPKKTKESDENPAPERVTVSPRFPDDGVMEFTVSFGGVYGTTTEAPGMVTILLGRVKVKLLL